MTRRRHILRRMLATGGVLLLLIASPGVAATADASGTATATVIQPLRVVAVADMEFGIIIHIPGTGGTVTVSPKTPGAIYTGGTSCGGADCGASHSARFAVSGEPQRNYSIQLPTSVIATGTATAPGAAAPSLTVGALTLRATSGSGAPSLDINGKDQFEVGGTVTVPPDLPPARYRASFSVMVSYI